MASYETLADVVAWLKTLQGNVSDLATQLSKIGAALGGKSISEQRTVSGTMAAGAGTSLHSLDVTGVPNAEGVFGVQISPATHNTFSFYVHRNPAVGLVFNNVGAAQNFTATYYVIG